MPRSFDLSAEYRSTVGRVRAAFGDQRYWLARLADSGADAATLDSMTTYADGSVEVAVTQAMYRHRLPALATQFHRGDLEVVRGEKWSPVRGDRAYAEITGRVLGAPASLSGNAVLAPTETGSWLTVTVTVQVDIPLVGATIENIIGAQLAELVAAEQRFTSDWVGRATPT